MGTLAPNVQVNRNAVHTGMKVAAPFPAGNSAHHMHTPKLQQTLMCAGFQRALTTTLVASKHSYTFYAKFFVSISTDVYHCFLY